MGGTTALLAAGVFVGLVLLAALLRAIVGPSVSRRIEALFRRPPRPARPPGKDHYYRPYWQR
jgi:hypothetical protein